MALTIALAGNPNSGKTTLFNSLTGANQFVGNWPGVTVEKKEGKLKKNPGVTITDLPGIYSLSPYTLEEVVARNYLINERPDAILNIIDGTNLERNLYLTTQLTELGIPVVVAINMMDVVLKSGDKINTKELSRALACPVVEISALKSNGVMEAAQAAIHAAQNGKTVPQHSFSGTVEHALAHKGKLDPERLDKFSSMSLEDQRKVVPMLHALREASDGRSWAGDIFGSFLGSVVEIPNRIALSSSAAWKRNVDGEATCDLVFEIWAMRKLAITAPVRDRGFLGNAFVHISFMLPYAGCAIPMQTNP